MGRHAMTLAHNSGGDQHSLCKRGEKEGGYDDMTRLGEQGAVCKYISARLKRIRQYAYTMTTFKQSCSSSNTFIVSGGVYGQESNQLIQFIHGLWAAKEMSGYLVVPKKMERALEPFHLDHLCSSFCFVGQDEYAEKVTDNNESKIVHIKPHMMFWLKKEIQQHKYALPKLSNELVKNMSYHFLLVYASLWGHLKQPFVAESCRLVASSFKEGLNYVAVHKRNLAKVVDSRMDEKDVDAISKQIPLSSRAWKAHSSKALCFMNASFIRDTVVYNGRKDMLSQPIFMAWDGQGESKDSDFFLSQGLKTILINSSQINKELLKLEDISRSQFELIVDKLVTINAGFSILNPASTFSFEIFIMRSILGLDSVPTPPTKDLYLQYRVEYEESTTRDWDGMWVSWKTIKQALISSPAMNAQIIERPSNSNHQNLTIQHV